MRSFLSRYLEGGAYFAQGNVGYAFGLSMIASIAAATAAYSASLGVIFQVVAAVVGFNLAFRALRGHWPTLF